jgi:hypothetical protein
MSGTVPDSTPLAVSPWTTTPSRSGSPYRNQT